MAPADRTVIRLSRRGFCQLAAGCAAMGLASCVMPGEAVETGALTPGDPEQPAPDGSVAQVADAAPGTPDARPGSPDATPPPDASTGGAQCTTTTVDVGAPSSFAMDTLTYLSTGKIFVGRDAGGLYAMTAVCPHQGQTMRVSGYGTYCPAHGATFDGTGNPTGGPVFTVLKHYTMCVLGTGHVAVETSLSTSQSTRLNA